ncbi:MAG: sulfotransferase family 2 domain-containing protein [Pseudomonadota bacterium]
MTLDLRPITRQAAQRLSAPFVARTLPRRVVFVHLPKTAGSSVHAFFVPKVGGVRFGQAVMLDDNAPAHRVALARRARYAGGHFGARMLERIGPGAFTFTFLRCPVERLISTWRFTQTHANPALRLPYATLEQALASDDPRVRQAFDNPMTRQLSAAFDLAQASALPRSEWLERSEAALDRFDFVGDCATFAADFAEILDRLALPPPAKTAEANRTDDPHRRNRDPSLSMPPIPAPAAVSRIAAHFLALDQALYAAWQTRRQEEGTR